MISYREWAVKKSGWSIEGNKQYYIFEGYFLFWFIPLYIKRIGR